MEARVEKVEAEAGRLVDLSSPVQIDVGRLPPLPALAWRIVELTSDPDSTAEEVAEVVRRDQSLTFEVLRLANSAFYQRSREIRTVDQAAVLLGNRRLRSLALAAALGPIMAQTRWGASMWEHSLGVALASREIARVCCMPEPEDFFVAGLLHDVGKLVFDTQFPEEFGESIRMLGDRPDLTTVDAELHCLGIPHTAAGSILALAWKLPPEITEVILYHHRPFLSRFSRELCSVVHLADAVCVKLGLGCRHLPKLDPFQFSSAWMLKLTPCTLQLAIERFETHLAADKATLGIR